MKKIHTDICIIGAGSGGLSLAAGAVQMGAKVVLVESGKMGGDCLNYGCVPSKALLAAAKRAHAIENAAPFGIASVKPKIDFAKVHAHVRGVIRAIEPHDSQERFEELGVKVIREKGYFISPKILQAGDTRISAKRFVIATGSSPAIPPISGLCEVKYLTNESIFNLKEAPKHLIIMGGGPIGCEMAQAFSRLGSKVSVIEMFSIFPKDDFECVDVIRKKLVREGIELYEGAQVTKVNKTNAGVSVEFDTGGKKGKVSGSHLLVAAGREANVSNLDLENADVEYTLRGIQVDDYLRTSNKKISAIGDVTGGLQFTHVANYHAGIVIRNILFRLPFKAKTKAIPWVTYTDPELAHVGMMHEEARGKYADAKTMKFPFAEIDRAVTERETEGLIKVTTTKGDKVLGVTIVGPHAGEFILPWVMAVHKGMDVGDMAAFVAPYPTLSEISKRVSGSFFTPMLFSKKIKRIVRFLLYWG